METHLQIYNNDNSYNTCEQHHEDLTTFPHYWSFVQQSPMDFPRKRSLARSFDVSLMLPLTNCWTKRWDAGDFRRIDAQVLSLWCYVRNGTRSHIQIIHAQLAASQSIMLSIVNYSKARYICAAAHSGRGEIVSHVAWQSLLMLLPWPWLPPKLPHLRMPSHMAAPGDQEKK